MSERAAADRAWESAGGEMAELAGSWFWETDGALVLRYLSGRARAIAGIEPERLIGLCYADLPGLEALRGHMAVRGLVHDVDTPDGPRRVRIDGDPQYDAGGRFTGYAGFAAPAAGPDQAEAAGQGGGPLDDVITRLKREQDALRQSEQRFARIFQFSPVSVSIAEIDDGTLLDMNEKWHETFGWPREEALGRRVLDLNIWVDHEQRDRFIGILRNTGRVRNFEAPLRTRSGEVRDILLSGEIVPMDGQERLLISGYDITERKRAEMALRYSEARLAGILRISPEAVIATDGQQKITLFNEGAERIFGYQALEVLGRPLDILVPEALRGSHRKHVERFRNSGDASRIMSAREEISARAKDGRVFPAEASISKLELQGETIFTVLLHDITDRKRAETVLLAAKEEAEAANRAKSEFLANMSHELRTPLNAIIGFSEIICNEVLGPVGTPRYAEYARDIQRSGEHLLEIIGDILDVARIDSGQVDLDEEPVNLSDMVDSSLVLVRDRALGRGLDLNVEMQPGLPLVACDRRRMMQVVINLLSNAVKFTRKGGRITVAARIEDCTGEAVIEVRDTGIGMAPEDIPRVMEPFVQIAGPLTRSHEGTGLGLPLVKTLAELHGGRLAIESELGVGTVARVFLPARRVIANAGFRKLANGA